MKKFTPPKYPDIESVAGAAGKLRRPLSWEEVRKIAQNERLKKFKKKKV